MQSHWLLSLLSAILLLPAFTACEHDTASGYSFIPEEINFEASGGTQTLKIDKGDYKYCSANFYNYGYKDEHDNQWLFMEEIDQETYKFTALPNVSKDYRQAKLKISFSNEEYFDTNCDRAFYDVFQKGYEGGTALFPFDPEKIESVSVTSCVTWGKFYSESNNREYDDDEGGGFNFLNDSKNKHSFTYETEASSNVVHVQLSGEANARKAFLKFDLVYFSNPNEGVSKITNFGYTLESPSENKRYFADITDIPITRIDDTTVYAEGTVKDGVKFTDFGVEGPNFDLLEPYRDSPRNRVSLYIVFGSR